MTIRQKQWQLFLLGFLEGREEIDGIWGVRSKGATEQFQRYFGLGVDGVFGPNTQAKSREVISGIQEILVRQSEVMLNIDGLAGPDTMEAVQNYQKIWGLVSNGIAGEVTREHMRCRGKEEKKEPTLEEDWWAEIRWFTEQEFCCKCGGRYCDGYPARMRKAAVVIADAARAHFGRPGIVVSGLRCMQHNANVGGVVNSQHMFGEAVDLRIEGVGADALLAFVKKQPGIRYAYKINGTNVHFDIPKGTGGRNGWMETPRGTGGRCLQGPGMGGTDGETLSGMADGNEGAAGRTAVFAAVGNCRDLLPAPRGEAAAGI